MFLMDYHTHTLVSPDGFAPLEDMAAAAAEAGLQELCVTDHCDLLSTDGERTLDHSWQPALEQYDRLEARRGLRVKLGVELGEAPVSPNSAAALAAMDRLDWTGWTSSSAPSTTGARRRGGVTSTTPPSTAPSSAGRRWRTTWTPWSAWWSCPGATTCWVT